MPRLEYVEEVDSTSPCSAGFAVERQEATSVYLLERPTSADLLDLPVDVLGDVVYKPGDGRVQRTLPLAHPVWPWLYAGNIRSVVGFGHKDTSTDPPTVAAKVASNSQLDEPSLPHFWRYVRYRLTIDFSARPYPVLEDDEILSRTGTWYYEGVDGASGQPAAAAVLASFQYVTEWDRWTDMDLDPKEQAVQGQQGTMRFRSTNDTVRAQIFPGQPRMNVPNQALRMIWYAVPYRYFLSDNSYLEKWVGRINQSAIRICGKNFGAGSLLYLGCKPRKYNPPVEREDFLWPGVFATEKLCNLELNFLWTTRTARAGDLPAAPANANFVMAGWNLFPWVVDRQYHFALAEIQAGLAGAAFVQPMPGFLSFPLEILQMDPDAPGALQTADY